MLDPGQELGGAAVPGRAAVGHGEVADVAPVDEVVVVEAVPPVARGEDGGVVEDDRPHRALTHRSGQRDVGHAEFVGQGFSAPVESLASVGLEPFSFAVQDQRWRLVEVGERVLQGPEVVAAVRLDQAPILEVEQCDGHAGHAAAPAHGVIGLSVRRGGRLCAGRGCGAGVCMGGEWLRTSGGACMWLRWVPRSRVCQCLRCPCRPLCQTGAGAVVACSRAVSRRDVACQPSVDRMGGGSWRARPPSWIVHGSSSVRSVGRTAAMLVGRSR